MINIAVVDDDEEYRLQEREFIERFAKESGEKFDVKCFNSGMDFITDYKPVFDIVFLDIEMPLLSGMETARRLRREDDKVCIIFITKMSKYAIEGYEVNAIDFVVKPIKYFNYIDKLKKVIIKSDENYFRLPVSSIYYVIKDKNYLIYRTTKGDIRVRGTMKTVEDELSDSGFSVCNSGCIVNLKLIGQVTPNCVIINGEQIPLSRRRIKDFKKEMLSYLRGGSL